MRELIARFICLLTLCVVVALAFLFAVRHNAPAQISDSSRTTNLISAPSTNVQVALPAIVASEPITNQSPAAVTIDRGRTIFGQQGCASCHSVAGAGNPRYPLDNIGSRMQVDDLREWVTGTGPATNRLSSAVTRRKQRYRNLPEDDMGSLVLYLSSLQDASGEKR